MKESNITRLKTIIDDKQPSQKTQSDAPESPTEGKKLSPAGQTTPQAEKSTGEPSEGIYEAYGISKSPMRGSVSNVQTVITQDKLKIRQKNDSGYSVPYSLMILKGHVSDHTITLYCTGYAVIIEGKNLTELRGLLEGNKVKWIQEFDGKRFTTSLKKLPEETPVITKIEIRFGR